MNRSFKVAAGSTLATIGVIGLIAAGFVLAREGLDRAEKWVSIIGLPLSLVIAVVGAVLAWRALRTTSRAESTARRTGNAFASGPQSRATTGVTGPAGATGTAEQTGAARALDGGSASSGVEYRGPER